MTRQTLMTLAAASILALGNANSIELTNETYEAATHGKSVFIKFYAPWCGHCRNMADDWDRLAKEWENHEVGLIASVDCTSDKGQVLCEDFEVQGFPTLLYGDSMSPETYDGGRDYESLAEFAKENLSAPICSFFMKDNCNEKDMKTMAELEAKSESELEAIAVAVEEEVKTAEADFDKEVERLQVEYDQMVAGFNSQLDRIKTDNYYKFVEQILSSKFAAHEENKDEL